MNLAGVIDISGYTDLNVTRCQCEVCTPASERLGVTYANALTRVNERHVGVRFGDVNYIVTLNGVDVSNFCTEAVASSADSRGLVWLFLGDHPGNPYPDNPPDTVPIHMCRTCMRGACSGVYGGIVEIAGSTPPPTETLDGG